MAKSCSLLELHFSKKKQEKKFCENNEESLQLLMQSSLSLLHPISFPFWSFFSPSFSIVFTAASAPVQLVWLMDFGHSLVCLWQSFFAAQSCPPSYPDSSKKRNSLRMANCLTSKERKCPIYVWYRVKWKDCTRTLCALSTLGDFFFGRSQNRAMNNNKWESSSERPSFSVELAFLSCPIAECVYVFTQVRLPEIINYREKLLIMVIFLDINSLAHIQSSTNLLIWVFMRRRINVYVRFVDYVWWNSREGLSRCSKETTQLWTSLREDWRPKENRIKI